MLPATSATLSDCERLIAAVQTAGSTVPTPLADILSANDLIASQPTPSDPGDAHREGGGLRRADRLQTRRLDQ